ncbi:MAG: carboxypeptidase-like regulatory domain-containing protein, partial [Myxococcales bacterium]
MRSHTRIPLALSLTALCALGGCGDSKAQVSVHPVAGTGLPGMPTPLVGKGTLSGKVSDAAGNPVVGATVKIAETDGKAITAADGTYQMTVPSDSTLTLVTVATGFANSARESIVVANEA